MRKALIFGGALLVTVIIGAGGYWVYREFDRLEKGLESTKQDLNNKTESLNKSNDELSKAKEDIENYKVLIDEYKENEEKLKNPYNGWRTFKSDYLGISFMYPSSYFVQQNSGGVDILSIFEDRKGGNEIVRKEVLSLSRVDYFEDNKELLSPFDSNDIRSVNISNKSYKFTKYFINEDGFGGFWKKEIFSFKFKPSVYVALSVLNLGDKTIDCDGINYPNEIFDFETKGDCIFRNESMPETEYKTSQEQIDKTILIIQSIKTV